MFTVTLKFKHNFYFLLWVFWVWMSILIQHPNLRTSRSCECDIIIVLWLHRAYYGLLFLEYFTILISFLNMQQEQQAVFWPNIDRSDVRRAARDTCHIVHCVLWLHGSRGHEWVSTRHNNSWSLIQWHVTGHWWLSWWHCHGITGHEDDIVSRWHYTDTSSQTCHTCSYRLHLPRARSTATKLSTHR